MSAESFLDAVRKRVSVPAQASPAARALVDTVLTDAVIATFEQLAADVGNSAVVLGAAQFREAAASVAVDAGRKYR